MVVHRCWKSVAPCIWWQAFGGHGRSKGWIFFLHSSFHYKEWTGEIQQRGSFILVYRDVSTSLTVAQLLTTQGCCQYRSVCAYFKKIRSLVFHKAVNHSVNYSISFSLHKIFLEVFGGFHSNIVGHWSSVANPIIVQYILSENKVISGFISLRQVKSLAEGAILSWVEG